MNHEIEELNRILRQTGATNVSLLEFSLTHHYLRLVLHRGDVPRGPQLVCRDVASICGPVQGGPYELTVQTVDDRRMELASAKRELVIRCGSILLEQEGSGLIPMG